MRTLEEVQKELDAVEAQIKAQQEGMPSYGDPDYRAARFDYIVEGDRSGLDAYQNAVNAAIQNKLSRESAEQMAKAGKVQADDEAMDQWQKDYSFAKSAQSDIYNNPSSTQKQKDDADATVRYHEAVGRRKGWLDKYKAMTAAPAKAVPAEEAASAATETPKETFKQLMGEVDKLTGKEGPVDPAEIDKLYEKLLDYKGNDFTTREVNTALAKLENKKKSDSDKADRDAMDKDAGAVKEALATGSADKIDAAVDAYEKHKDKSGYNGESAVKARKEAETIRKNAKYAARKAKAGPKVNKSKVYAANSKNEKQVQYVDEDGTRFNFNYQFVNDQPQIFYGGKWHEVKE